MRERAAERWIKDFSELRMVSIFSGLVGADNATNWQESKEQRYEDIASEAVEERCVYEIRCGVWFRAIISFVIGVWESEF